MPPPAEPADEAHRHAWTLADFLVTDDRPMMSQVCGCGTTRVIPAWDRSWTPPVARRNETS